MLRGWMKMGTAAALLFAGIARATLADTIVLTDGRTFVGDVTVAGADYTIKTKFGEFHVTADEVAQWQKDGASAPAGGDIHPSVDPGTGPAAKLKPAPVDKPAVGAASHDPTSVDKAQAAMESGDFKTAIALLAPLSTDSHDPRLLHILGLAYFKQHDVKSAIRELERATTLAGEQTDAALVINTAAADVAGQYPARPIKFLSNFLSSHQTDVNEHVLNALGIALWKCDDNFRATKNFSNATDLYFACNKTLESTKPGNKRVGTQWYASDEADAKLSDLNNASNNLRQARDDAGNAAERLSQAKTKRNQMGLMSNRRQRQAADEEIKKDMADLQSAQDRVRTCAAAIKSPFPDSIDLEPLAAAATSVVTGNDPKPREDPKPKSDPTPPEVTMSDEPKPTPVPNKPDPAKDPTPAPAPKPAAPAESKDADYAAAFPVADHLLITSKAVTTGGADISIQGKDGIAIKAVVVRVDDASGLALIRVDDVQLKYLGFAKKFDGGKFVCPGFDQVDLFNPAPTMMPGTADAPKDGWTVNIPAAPHLAGSPVLVDGEIVGVEMATDNTPGDKIPAITLDAVKKFLGNDLPDAPANKPDPQSVVVQVVASRK